MPAAQKIDWLEAMRAAAACWVLLHHANQTVSAFVGTNAIIDVISRNGFLGVDFFFLLSGFIIAHSSNRLVATGRGLRDYVQARLTRIYVPYLPIGCVMLLLYMAFPDISHGDRDPGVLTSISLIPSNAPTALSVAWTLVHEMIFYAIFSLYFINRRALWLALIAWTLVISTNLMFGEPAGRLGVGYFLSPLNLCFLFGVGIYHFTRRGVGGATGVVLGVAGLGLVAWVAAQGEPSRIFSSLGFAGLIVCATSEIAKRRSPGKPWMYLGAASYAIYLVHDPFESLVVRVVMRFAPDLGVPGAFLCIAVSALAAGCLYHSLYERPALRFVRNRFANHDVSGRRIEPQY